MRFLTPKQSLLLLAIFFWTTTKMVAQGSNLTVSSDPKFDQLLAIKIKSNPNLSYNDRYKIQIFSGTNDIAKKTFYDFKQDYKNLDGTIIFNTPNYKVWVGNFRTRMEAEYNLADIQKKYKNVFIIKPSK